MKSIFISKTNVLFLMLIPRIKLHSFHSLRPPPDDHRVVLPVTRQESLLPELGLRPRLWSQSGWDGILAPLRVSPVTLGELLNLSGSPFTCCKWGTPISTRLGVIRIE